MEKQFKGTKKGLWHSLWHKMGQNQEAADAWMAFIPDDYGLVCTHNMFRLPVHRHQKWTLRGMVPCN